MKVFIKPDAKETCTVKWIPSMDSLPGTVREVFAMYDKSIDIKIDNYIVCIDKCCTISIPENTYLARVKDEYNPNVKNSPGRPGYRGWDEFAGKYLLFEKSAGGNYDWFNLIDKTSWIFHGDWLDIVYNPNPNEPPKEPVMREIKETPDFTLPEYKHAVIVRNNELFFNRDGVFRHAWNDTVLKNAGESGDIIYKFDSTSDPFKTLYAGQCLDKYKKPNSSILSEVKGFLKEGKMVARVYEPDGTKRVLYLSGDDIYGYSKAGDSLRCIHASHMKYYLFNNHIELVEWLTK